MVAKSAKVPPPKPTPANAGVFRAMVTEDSANTVFDPIRALLVSGGAAALAAMLSMIVVLLYQTILKATSVDLTAFGTGFAAVLGGLGVLAGGSGAGLLAKAHADKAEGSD